MGNDIACVNAFIDKMYRGACLAVGFIQQSEKEIVCMVVDIQYSFLLFNFAFLFLLLLPCEVGKC